MTGLISYFDLIAVGVFAISGALAAAEEKLDVLGFILFGILTGVGGGTVRDLLLQSGPVFWIASVEYLWVCIGAAIATWFLAPFLQSAQRLLLWADAAGLALFSVLGAAKALDAGMADVVAVVMGVVSASFGSLLRDTLMNRIPILLGPEIYVTACLVGAASYLAMIVAGVPD
ncbi:MAG: trimeric intracellular cation channel family protein, partial [Chromatocurvus sp.]